MFDGAFGEGSHEVALQDMRNSTTTGTLIMKLAAIRPGKSELFSEKNRWMPIGQGQLLVLG